MATITIVALILLAASASASWFSTEFNSRHALNVTRPGGCSDGRVLVNYPLLLRFSTGDEPWRHVRSSGKEMRFVPANDSHALDFEVEEWSTAGGIVWVRADLECDVTRLWVYFNSSKNESTFAFPSSSATTSPQDAWIGYNLVLHLGATSPADATRHGVTVTNYGSLVSTDGIVGNSQQFRRSIDDKITVLAKDTYVMQSGRWSFEFWARLDGLYEDYQSIFCLSPASGSFFANQCLQIGFRARNQFSFDFNQNAITWDAPMDFNTSTGAGTWHHFAGTYDFRAQNDVGVPERCLYCDGVLVSDDLGKDPYIGYSWYFASAYTIGCHNSLLESSSGKRCWFNGLVDEFRITGEVLSADWIRANYEFMMPDRQYWTIAPEPVPCVSGHADYIQGTCVCHVWNGAKYSGADCGQLVVENQVAGIVIGSLFAVVMTATCALMVWRHRTQFGRAFSTFVSSARNLRKLGVIRFLRVSMGASESGDNVESIEMTLSNVLVVIELVVEFLQLTSFSVIVSIPWSDWFFLKALSNIVVFDTDNSTAFVSIFVCACLVAWFFTLFVGSLMIKRRGQLLYLKFVRWIPIAPLVLPVIGRLLFIPILKTLLASLSCHDYVMLKCESVYCWQPVHVAFVIPAVVTSMAFYPCAVRMMTVWNAATKSDRDVQFSETFLLILIQFKALLCGLASFFFDFSILYVSLVAVVTFLLLVANVFLVPCSVPWMNFLRSSFLFLAFVAAVFAIGVVAVNDRTSYVLPIIILVVYLLIVVGAVLLWRKLFSGSSANRPKTSDRQKRLMDAFQGAILSERQSQAAREESHRATAERPVPNPGTPRRPLPPSPRV